MRNSWLFVFCFLLSGLPGFGQGRDTVFAVHKLFQQKRRSSDQWVAAGATTAAGETAGGQATQLPASVMPAAIANAGASASVGLLRYRRYSREREAVIIQRYNEGWSIPPDIRRKLRRKYFHRTSHDVGLTE